MLKLTLKLPVFTFLYIYTLRYIYKTKNKLAGVKTEVKSGNQTTGNMDRIQEQKLKALEELYELEGRIKEMQAARDRQAKEWRKMINLAIARRTALQNKIAALGVAVYPEGAAADPEENETEDDGAENEDE